MKRLIVKVTLIGGLTLNLSGCLILETPGGLSGTFKALSSDYTSVEIIDVQQFKWDSNRYLEFQVRDGEELIQLYQSSKYGNFNQFTIGQASVRNGIVLPNKIIDVKPIQKQHIKPKEKSLDEKRQDRIKRRIDVLNTI